MERIRTPWREGLEKAFGEVSSDRYQTVSRFAYGSKGAVNLGWSADVALDKNGYRLSRLTVNDVGTADEPFNSGRIPQKLFSVLERYGLVLEERGEGSYRSIPVDRPFDFSKFESVTEGTILVNGDELIVRLDRLNGNSERVVDDLARIAKEAHARSCQQYVEGNLILDRRSLAINSSGIPIQDRGSLVDFVDEVLYVLAESRLKPQDFPVQRSGVSPTLRTMFQGANVM